MSEQVSHPVIIIGGGLAGLNCANHLNEQGIDFLLIEKSHRTGGRLKTDYVDGYMLDHGFQVLQTAYPEAKAALDYEDLDLQPFEPGALIYLNGKFKRMTDPWRRPMKAIASLANGIGTVKDRLIIGNLRQKLVNEQSYELKPESDMATIEYLTEKLGLSNQITEQFFRPWFQGIFLEKNLSTASNFFEFIFQILSVGDASIPSAGMGAIPAQLTMKLPEEKVRLDTQVTKISEGKVYLDSGEELIANAIVIATEGNIASHLLKEISDVKEIPSEVACSVACHYFSADESPILEPTLVLNGNPDQLVNNLCVLSEVNAACAPEGKSLVSVSSLEINADQAAILEELKEWFGEKVESWRHIKTYKIPYALPKQEVGFSDRPQDHLRVQSGIYCCGDHQESASINGALLSGRKTAELILRDLAQVL